MLTVVLAKQKVEQTVIDLTKENMKRELKSVNNSELLITEGWSEGIGKCKTEYICLIEPDCLVSSGYFASQVGLFKKNPMYRQLGIMTSSTSIVNWANKIYGYDLADRQTLGVVPIKHPASSAPYRLPIAYIPGSIMRLSTLKRVLENNRKDHIIGSGLMKLSADLTYFSTMVSLAFWRLDSHICINPNASYCTTEDYVGEKGNFDNTAGDLYSRFKKELQ